jgi:hypothetical protein
MAGGLAVGAVSPALPGMGQGDAGHPGDHLAGMSQLPDQPPPAKPKLTPEERRARQADRLITIRLRMLIGRKLEDRGITTPVAIGDVLGMPAAEAVKLMNRHQWREGDVALLQAAAARLGVQVPGAAGEAD